MCERLPDITTYYSSVSFTKTKSDASLNIPCKVREDPGTNIGRNLLNIIRLSRLISGILRDLYGIQQKPLVLQAELAQKYETERAEWRAGIATFLDTSNVELLQITFQRQFSVLYLAFEHAKILLYRPFLLRNLASLGRERSAAHSNLQEVIARFVTTCVEAAIKTAEMFKDLCRTRRMYKSFWVSFPQPNMSTLILSLTIIVHTLQCFLCHRSVVCTRHSELVRTR